MTRCTPVKDKPRFIFRFTPFKYSHNLFGRSSLYKLLDHFTIYDRTPKAISKTKSGKTCDSDSISKRHY